MDVYEEYENLTISDEERRIRDHKELNQNLMKFYIAKKRTEDTYKAKDLDPSETNTQLYFTEGKISVFTREKDARKEMENLDVEQIKELLALNTIDSFAKKMGTESNANFTDTENVMISLLKNEGTRGVVESKAQTFINLIINSDKMFLISLEKALLNLQNPYNYEIARGIDPQASNIVNNLKNISDYLREKNTVQLNNNSVKR